MTDLQPPKDMRRVIENSDRGITLNKQLAWTMLVALISMVWWGATTINNLQRSIEVLTTALQENRVLITAEQVSVNIVEERVRNLEMGAGRLDARLEALSQSLDEVKASQRETNALLRELQKERAP